MKLKQVLVCGFHPWKGIVRAVGPKYLGMNSTLLCNVLILVRSVYNFIQKSPPTTLIFKI